MSELDVVRRIRAAATEDEAVAILQDCLMEVRADEADATRMHMIEHG